MAEYWGLDAIAKRLGMHTTTLQRLYQRQRFLMFQRRHRIGLKGKFRVVWYTNDELIGRWEMMQCAVQWRIRMARSLSAQPERGVDTSGRGVKR